MSELPPELIVYALALFEDKVVSLGEAEQLGRLMGGSREEFVAHLYFRRKSFDSDDALKASIDASRKRVVGPRRRVDYPHESGWASAATKVLEENMIELMTTMNKTSASATRLQEALVEFRRSRAHGDHAPSLLDEPHGP